MFSLFTKMEQNRPILIQQKSYCKKTFQDIKKLYPHGLKKFPNYYKWKLLLRTFAAAAAASASACFRLRSSSLKKYKLLIQFQK